MASSSPTCLRANASGSKIITDPGKLGPDLLETLIEALRRLGHGEEGSRASGWQDVLHGSEFWERYFRR